MAFFLDTNIILRHLLADDLDKANRSRELLARIEREEVKALTSDIVMAEVVFVLERSYRVPKKEIRELLLPIILFRGLILPRKLLYLPVFDLYIDQNISFADAYNAILMKRLKVTEVASYDTHFDRVEGIRRFEP